MTTSVKLPSLGAGVKDVVVLRWLKQVGEPVHRGDTLVEVETDKIATEICAEHDGTLLEIHTAPGARVPTGGVLAVLGDDSSARGREQPSARLEVEGTPHLESGARSLETPIARTTGARVVSPVVSRMAAEHGLDLAQIAGTGEGGRVTKRDVQAYLAHQGAPTADLGPATAIQALDRLEVVSRPPSAVAPEADLIPLSPMRARIAEHMVYSVRTSPHVTTVFEVDLGAVAAHRDAHKAAYAAEGVKLTWLAYLVAAVAGALKAHPIVNSQWVSGADGRDQIAVLRDIHIGIAVAVEGGLLVPVLRHADELNLKGIARQIDSLAGRARAKTLNADDLRGGTFSITNHGGSGSLLATPILNQPQSAILGFGAVEKRVRVLTVNGAGTIAIRPCAYLSLTFDHRVLDGAQADAFVSSVKRALETHG